MEDIQVKCSSPSPIKLNVEENKVCNQCSIKVGISQRLIQRRSSKLEKLDNPTIPRELVEIIAKRKSLYKRRMLCADIALILAIIGLACAIALQELQTAFSHLNDEDLYHPARITILILQLFVLTTSIILVFVIGCNYLIIITIKKLNNGIDDWKLVLSAGNVFSFLLEALLVSIHPYFFNNSHELKIILLDNYNEEFQAGFKYHTLLTVLMFTRIYLLARWLVFHHRLANSSIILSLGRLNSVEVGFGFIIKTILQENPWIMLVSMIAIVLTGASWSIRVCESAMLDNASPMDSFWNSLWLIVITYYTVGYVLSSQINKKHVL